jgi:hypothetical protein
VRTSGLPKDRYHHFHVDAKCVGKLSRQHRVIFFKAVDKHFDAITDKPT